ncbi:hypothetical protein ACQYRI_14420 [Salmonella enterica]
MPIITSMDSGDIATARRNAVGKEERQSLLLQHCNATDSSTRILPRHNGNWQPLRMVEWLKNAVWPTAKNENDIELTDVLSSGRQLHLAAENQAALSSEQPFGVQKLPCGCTSWLLLGISIATAVGTLFHFHTRAGAHRPEYPDGEPPQHGDAEIAFDAYPYNIENSSEANPLFALPLQYSDNNSTKKYKMCHTYSIWFPGQIVTARCPLTKEERAAHIAEMLAREARSTTTAMPTTTTVTPTTQKYKMCTTYSIWNPRFSYKVRCALTAEEKAQLKAEQEAKNNRTTTARPPTPPPTTTTTTALVITSKMPPQIKKYFQLKTQQPFCQEERTLRSCERIHARHKNTPLQRLDISIDNHCCSCPPPQKRLAEFDIHYLDDPADVCDPHGSLDAITNNTDQIRISVPPRYMLKRGGRLLRYRLPDEVRESAGTKQLNEMATSAPPDDIKIEKMDFGCIESRNNLSLADWLRIIGATMESPISRLSEESLVIDNLAKGKGCPTAEQLEAMQAITAPIDRVLTDILTLLPGSKPILVAQCIIGPLLQLAADSLQGKEPSQGKWVDVFTQLSNLAHEAAHTLTVKERTKLYNQPAKEISRTDKEIISKRFIFRDGIGHILVENKHYELHTLSDGTPFIINEKQELHYVYYNQFNETWNFTSTEKLFTADNIEKQNKYGTDLTKYGEVQTIKFDESQNNGYATLIYKDGKELKGVFVGNVFVEAKVENIHSHWVGYTTAPGQDEELVLEYSLNSGWTFDPATTKIDTYLTLLLESDKYDARPPSEIKVEPIDNFTGFSISKNNGLFIKKDDKYFRVLANQDSTTSKYKYSLADFPENELELELGNIRLSKEENMLFPFKNHIVVNFEDWHNSFHIEHSTLDFLRKHADKSTITQIKLIRPGIFSDNDGKMCFAVDKEKFKINKETGRHIYIASNSASGRKDDIILWSDERNYLRVRENKQITPTEYDEINYCRTMRGSSSGAACLPVRVETILHLRLMKLKASRVINIPANVIRRLTPVNTIGIPFLYKDNDTQQYYFFYDGTYFEATLIDANHKNNPTGHTGIQILGESNFFRKKTPFTKITIIEKNNKYEIKTMETFVAETLNIDNPVAMHYIIKRAWRDLPGMDDVEEAVNEVVLYRSAVLNKDESLIKVTSEQQSLSDEWKAAEGILIPQRIAEGNEHYTKMFELDINKDTLSLYEKKSLQLIQEGIHYIEKKIIPAISTSLYYESPYWSTVENYLSEIFTYNNSIFFNNFAIALRARLNALKSELSTLVEGNRIYILTSRSRKNEAAKIEHIKSLLTPKERSDGDAVWIANNANGRMFINIDKINFDHSLQDTSGSDAISAILQALSTTRGMTADFVETERVNGFYLPVKNAIDEMIDKLEWVSLNEKQSANLKLISDPFLQATPGYQHRISSLQEPEKLAYLARHDATFLAHLILRSPHLSTLVIEDLYHKISLNQLEGMPSRIDNWMKSYGEQRDFTLINERQQIRQGLPTKKVMENVMSTSEFNGKEYLQEAQEITEISHSIEYPKGKSSSIAPVVVNFMKTKKFINIYYRAMAMFLSPDDGSPVIHFAVTGEILGQEYVFDLTAGQFAEKYEELNGPIILPEKIWAQKYASLSDRLLIKYADYPTLDQAMKVFNPHNKNIHWGPNKKIPDAMVLRQPYWYFPDAPMENTPALPGREYAGRLGYTNPIREAARLSQLSTGHYIDSGNYAVTLLENAELLTKGRASELRAGLMYAMDPEVTTHTPGEMELLLENAKIVNNEDELLRIRPGQLLVFMATFPDRPGQNALPVHVMTSTGDGCFAGLKNSILDPSLGDEKKILTAEQLGMFEEGRFRHKGVGAISSMKIVSGYPRELLIQRDSNIRTIASRTPPHPNAGKAISHEMTTLLRTSGELSPGQSLALNQVLRSMMDETSEVKIAGKPSTSLLLSPRRIERQSDLDLVPQGGLVFFVPHTSTYTIKHVMYGLGQGDFLMIDPSHLHPALKSPNAIIQKWQFPDELFTQHRVWTGQLNLKELRISTLLGPDSKFVVKDNILKITAHGSASSVWFMDAGELVDVIKGLGLRKETSVDWAKIEQIELNSCYSALGRLPIGKALSYMMGVKVTAWPRLYSEKLANDKNVKKTGKMFSPQNVQPQDLLLIKKQSTRNYYVWSYFLKSWIYRTFDHLRRRRDIDATDEMFKQVITLALGNITTGQFLTALPDYKAQIFVTPQLLDSVCQEEIKDENAFAERCMDIINSSKYSYDLLNQFLSKLD